MRNLKLTVGNWIAVLQKNGCTKMIEMTAMNSRIAQANAYAYAGDIDAQVLAITRIPSIIERVDE